MERLKKKHCCGACRNGVTHCLWHTALSSQLHIHQILKPPRSSLQKAEFPTMHSTCMAKTASGELFEADSLTGAHCTLPFGASVRVTNLNNEKQVVVRINDRGPFRKGESLTSLRQPPRKSASSEPEQQKCASKP